VSSLGTTRPRTLTPRDTKGPPRPWRPRVLRVAKLSTLLVIVAVTLAPFLLVLMTSLKTKVDSVALPPKWLFSPTLDNYIEQLANEEFFRAALNSLLIASAATVVATAAAILAGYALARFRFRGRQAFAYSFLLVRAVPPIAFVIPYFLIWRDLDQVQDLFTFSKSYPAIIVMYLTLALPLMVWMLRSFFVEVPVEIEEAAMVDGCTRAQAMRYVLIPNVMPGIVAAAGLSFIVVWNEFMYALFNTGIETQTLPVQIYQSLGYFETNWAKLSSAAVVAVIPAVLFVAFTQRYIVRGLSMGAVKG
jgi:multiple sugar transport system permease protein